MIQLALFIYGIYALIAAKFTLGKGKTLVGGAARLLGAICLLSLPFSAAIGFVLGLLAAAGIIELPEGPGLLLIDVGTVVATLVIVFVYGNRLYKRQQQLESERAQAEIAQADPLGPKSSYSVADPDNPYASPVREA